MIEQATIERIHRLYRAMPEFEEALGLEEMTARTGAEFLGLVYRSDCEQDSLPQGADLRSRCSGTRPGSAKGAQENCP